MKLDTTHHFHYSVYKKGLLLTCILGILLFGQVAKGQTLITVNDVASLQSAVSSANSLDTIRLGASFPATFAANIALTISHNNTFVMDGGGQVYTVAGNFRHFTISKSGTGSLVFVNFTFKGRRNDTDGMTSGTAGGGIANSGASKGTLWFENCRFLSINGGALVFSDMDANSNVMIRNCTFKNNNKGDHGGAIYSSGTSNLQINNTTFDSNYCNGVGYSGGAIALFNATGQTYLNSCVFHNNQAMQWGGAIGVYNASALNFNLYSCLFEKNKTTVNGGNGDGGAISIHGGSTNNVQAYIALTAFLENSSSDDGGALYLQNRGTGANTYITNCLFYKNTANDYSDASNIITGIYSSGGGAIHTSLNTTVTLEVNTFVGNAAPKSTNNGGGALGVHAHPTDGFNPSYILSDNIFIDNKSPLANRENISTRLPTHLTDQGANLGVDNGSALPSNINSLTVFGVTPPLPTANFNTRKIGNPADSTINGYYTIIPSIPILPNDGIHVLGLADDQGQSYQKEDIRSFGRGFPRDIGSVDMIWHSFDATGGVWNGMPDLNYEGTVYYTKNNSNAVEQYYQINYSGGKVVPPPQGPPTKTDSVFSHWVMDSINGPQWNETPFSTYQNQRFFAVWTSIDTLPFYCAGEPIGELEYLINDTSLVVPGSGYWTLDGVKTDTLSSRILTRADSGKVVQYHIETYCAGEIASNKITLGVVDKPSILDLSYRNLYCAQDSLFSQVNVNANGSPITTYKWTLEGQPIGNNADTLLLYPLDPSYDGKKLQIVVSNACGSDTLFFVLNVKASPSFEFEDILLCGSTTADLTSLIPASGSVNGLNLSYFTDSGCTIPYPTPSAAVIGTYYIKGSSTDNCSHIADITIGSENSPLYVLLDGWTITSNADGSGSLRICASNIGTTNAASSFYVSVYRDERRPENRITTGTFPSGPLVGDSLCYELAINTTNITGTERWLLFLNDSGSAKKVIPECDSTRGNAEKQPLVARVNLNNSFQECAQTINFLRNDLYGECKGGSLTVYDTLVNKGPRKGGITFQSDSIFSYTASIDERGIDSLSYYLSCGADSALTTIYLLINDPLDPDECPSSTTTIGFKSTPEISYSWYSQQTGGSPISGGADINSLQISKDTPEDIGTWWVEPSYNTLRFPRIKISVSW